MSTRFLGQEAREKLERLLSRQRMVQGDSEIASQLAQVAEVVRFDEGDVIIKQDDEDDDLYLIVSGRVMVVANGREVAIRKAEHHVGEMIVIDPALRRSADVIALEKTTAARISESDSVEIAGRHPTLWRELAVELCERLSQRNRLITPPNPRPVLFIGSSIESLQIAQEIQLGLSHDDFRVRIWTDQVFGASRFAIEDLETQVAEADFALLVLGPEDTIVSRGEESQAPRDNVIFELGLFMGALSHERTFLLLPRKTEIKIPTDLLGLTPLDYRPAESQEELAENLGPVCTSLRAIITNIFAGAASRVDELITPLVTVRARALKSHRLGVALGVRSA